MPQRQTKSPEEAKRRLRDTVETGAAIGRCRQPMSALPTEPDAILRYAFSELQKTMCREDDPPSIVHVRHILNEGIAFLKAEAAR